MSATTRSIKEGIGFGLIAGAIFALAEVIAAVVMGQNAIMPFRMFASVVIGNEALDQTAAAPAVLVGAFVHLVLSGTFGLLYGIYNSALTIDTRRGVLRQAALGAVFGVLIWMVNFQVIARAFLPWFLDSPQVAQALLHAMFYGLPLGLMYAASERHQTPVQQPLAYR